MAHFKGTYKLAASHNFDSFLAALAVNPLLRQIGIYTQPTLVISVSSCGRHFQLKQSAAVFKKYQLEFDLEETFVNKTIDGRVVTSTVELLEDGRLIQRDSPDNPEGKDTVFIRKINEDGDLIMTCQVDDIVCTRVYKRTAPLS